MSSTRTSGLVGPRFSIVTTIFFDLPYAATARTRALGSCSLVHPAAGRTEHGGMVDPLSGQIDGVFADLRIGRTYADNSGGSLRVEFQRHVGHARFRLLQAIPKFFEVRGLGGR